MGQLSCWVQEKRGAHILPVSWVGLGLQGACVGNGADRSLLPHPSPCAMSYHLGVQADTELNTFQTSSPSALNLGREVAIGTGFSLQVRFVPQRTEVTFARSCSMYVAEPRFNPSSCT